MARRMRRGRPGMRRFKRRDREYVWCTVATAIRYDEGPEFVSSTAQLLCAGADLMPTDLEKRSHEVTLLRVVGTLDLGYSTEQSRATTTSVKTFQAHYGWYIAKFHGDETFDVDPDLEDVITTGALHATYTREWDVSAAPSNYAYVSQLQGTTRNDIDVRNRRKLSGVDQLALVVGATDQGLLGDTESTELFSQIIVVLRTLWLVT